jgi:hypothetical protein
MGLLENNPDLIDDYERLAKKFLHMGYVAPVNVLWTFFYIHGNHQRARELWEAHVRDCPQIMFQKICQTARYGEKENVTAKLAFLQ